MRLSRKQREAVAILERTGQPGVITSGATGIFDRQPWINWRTAYSLHDKGVAWITNYGEEDAEVRLFRDTSGDGR